MPPSPERRKLGSRTPSAGIVTSPPRSRSVMSRSPAVWRTALWICAFARRRKRWRLARLLPPGLRRRSMMYIGTPKLPPLSPSARLLHAHVPLHETPDLALGVTTLHHPLHELPVLLLGLAVLLRAEADDGKEFLDLREHPALDD